ncbi:thiopeptide-type bacteriocin biosynthesis domain-containing protein [Promicromonospora umidemergens]|uniref:Lantibiotic dehydratase n=1 Tax=Promicromonospora umidemergens TaxID=629679 RepID=A0ABP8WSH5_9MICO|nr:lantibiotic dehydratase [Promicromonospora umidemergens]MCP2283422.1 thiopeptide-type bacteriocin biosynthesis domain-containing protein [Promicromonospora umidemergens]
MGSWAPDMKTAVLRASTHLIDSADLAKWPGDDADYDAWRAWIEAAWSQPGISAAVTLASPSLADRIGGLLTGRVSGSRVARRAATSLAGYIVRARGRATPFGAFAGTTTASFAATAAWNWSPVHRARLRPDARWLSGVVQHLESDPDVLHRISVQTSNLLTGHVGDIVVPWQPHLSAPPVEGQDADVHIQRLDVVDRILRLAAIPISVGDLATQVADEQPGCTGETVVRLVAQLVGVGALVTALRPPGTVTDPLAHIVGHLIRTGAGSTSTRQQLADLAAQLRDPQASTLQDTARAATAAATTMRELAPAIEVPPVAIDLQVGARAVLPDRVAAEAVAAAETLVRVAPPRDAGWSTWRAQFLDRYGPATPIPVTCVIDPITGIGLPDHFTTPTAGPVTRRDEALLALAGQAMLDRRRVIELDTATLATLGGEPGAELLDGAGADLWFDVRAASLRALQSGEFRLGVSGFGRRMAAAGRFADLLDIQPQDARAPKDGSGTLVAQMSFPPRDLRTENTLRVPLAHDHVIALGEHRTPDPHVMTLDDLAVMGDSTGRLHLVSRRHESRVEVRVPHAGARHTMPPVARFVYEVSRTASPVITGFDWGAATALPHLPRVTCGRAILSPARWRLRLPADSDRVEEALDRYGLPRHVDAGTGDQILRLDLHEAMDRTLLHDRATSAEGWVTLREAPEPSHYGWCQGRAHEVVLAMTTRGHTRSTPLVVAPAEAHASMRRGVTFARIAAPSETHEAILIGHLSALTEPWPAGSWWYTRARGELRLRVHDTGLPATAGRIAAWSDQLRNLGLARKVTLDEYIPETGRYGTGQTLTAAEALFAADSQVALILLKRLQTRPDTHRRALLAASLADLTAALTGGHDAGMRWLIDHPRLSGTPQAPRRDERAQALALADTVPENRLAAAWRARATAAGVYTERLHTDGVRAAPVIGSLLHMHHVRVAGIDPDEAVTHKLARAIALKHAATQEVVT